jgi:demethylmenaquinone methyltransferase/2-methoxy-6-polyprenyl-1,4-benzoquinol methylase
MKPIEANAKWASYFPDPAQRSAFTRALFDDTARHYDRINRMFSFGSGAWYRRQALIGAGLSGGMQVLDVATGTGLVAREAAGIVGEHGKVVGLDLSAGMLAELRRSLDLPAIQAAAESLPVPADCFDFVCMGYALRHVADLKQTFAEFRRVLRPGGTLLILEIGRPARPLGLAVAKTYFGRIIPWLSRWTTGAYDAQTLMRYYWDTIEYCVPPEAIMAALSQSDLDKVRCSVEHGIFRAYSATKA